ncbi:MAG: hypothetical protein DCC71_18740 [Proteobacteria bacterium]|nr:MAG: hypothetical protein DCC71_18740 [Pseudomonadota bacterium]
MKAIVLVLWVACLAAFALPEHLWWASAGRMLFFGLIVVHAVEFALFLPKLRAAGGSLGHHFVQVMLFGIVHVRSLAAPAR